jgi:tRNA threonylcarbamoyladenosine biosynthesis protein TsaE
MQIMELYFYLNDIENAAQQFLDATGGRKVFAFHGEMGAGKTTFINSVCKQMGVSDVVSSPTFSIINQYKTYTGQTIYHLDLYRLKDEEEAIMTGVEDCFYSGHYCFIEWPEKSPGLLPDDTVHCFLTLAGNDSRKLQIKL